MTISTIDLDAMAGNFTVVSVLGMPPSSSSFLIRELDVPTNEAAMLGRSAMLYVVTATFGWRPCTNALSASSRWFARVLCVSERTLVLTEGDSSSAQLMEGMAEHSRGKSRVAKLQALRELS